MAWKNWWWLPWLYFLSLTTFVVWPWFITGGYLFLLDFVWTPILSLPVFPAQTGYISFPWQWLWRVLAYAIPSDLLQKVVLAIPLLLSGVTAYYLIIWLGTRYSDQKQSVITLAALAAGTFYALNPFVFTRVVMGQLYLLMAYGLAPWALLIFLQAMDKPTTRRGLYSGIAVITVMLANAHHLILVPLMLLFFIKIPRRENMRTWVAILTPLALLALLSLISYHSAPRTSTSLDPLGPWARALQAPYSGNLFVDTVTLTATWKTDLSFAWPYELLAIWPIITVILLLIMLAGWVYFYRQKQSKYFMIQLLLLLVVSIILVLGVAHPVTRAIAAWLYQHVPGWIGLRDSAKFLSLLALAETILLGLGIIAVAAVTRRLLSPKAAIASAVTILLLTLYATSPALAGFSQQIFPLAYPPSWYELNERWLSESTPPRALFLPWHMYLPFAFTANRTVVNPAHDFFTNANIISGDNSEVGGSFGQPFIYSESDRSLSRYIENFIKQEPESTNIGEYLAKVNIQYIVLATDTWDMVDYNWLYNQSDLIIDFKRPDLLVWKNMYRP